MGKDTSYKPPSGSFTYYDMKHLARKHKADRFWFHVWAIIAVLAICTLLYFLVPDVKVPEAHADYTDYQTDASICKDSLLYFVGGQTDIVKYCENLEARGL